jgi:hypothetical protein
LVCSPLAASAAHVPRSNNADTAVSNDGVDFKAMLDLSSFTIRWEQAQKSS